MCFYNPARRLGCPGWQAALGRGSQRPNGVASAGERMIVTWPFAEGAAGSLDWMQRARRNGRKRGMARVAADARYAYGVVVATSSDEILCRFDVETGRTDLSCSRTNRASSSCPCGYLPGPPPGKTAGMAVQDGTLVLAMSNAGWQFWMRCPPSSSRRSMFRRPACCFREGCRIMGVFANKIQALNLATGALSPIRRRLGRPWCPGR